MKKIKDRRKILYATSKVLDKANFVLSCTKETINYYGCLRPTQQWPKNTCTCYVISRKESLLIKAKHKGKHPCNQKNT
uniref:Uncharacterized protein n=1 Tax=Rhizophora mucronata TaxID=61149 RepID=A0A2P2NQX8_RHIMU